MTCCPSRSRRRILPKGIPAAVFPPELSMCFFARGEWTTAVPFSPELGCCCKLGGDGQPLPGQCARTAAKPIRSKSRFQAVQKVCNFCAIMCWVCSFCAILVLGVQFWSCRSRRRSLTDGHNDHRALSKVCKKPGFVQKVCNFILKTAHPKSLMP